jgi:hypothetical protein
MAPTCLLRGRGTHTDRVSVLGEQPPRPRRSAGHERKQLLVHKKDALHAMTPRRWTHSPLEESPVTGHTDCSGKGPLVQSAAGFGELFTALAYHPKGCG